MDRVFDARGSLEKQAVTASTACSPRGNIETHSSFDECISQCRTSKENIDKQHTLAKALEQKEQEVKALVKQSDEAVTALKRVREKRLGYR